MLSKRAQRIIVISGKKGYVQLLPEEQKALRIEVYFSATNIGEGNYYSYEWYKERGFFGRIKIAHGEYTSREKLLQYQNELIYSEEATLFETVKRIQCGLQKQYEVNKFLVEGLIKIASASSIVLGFGTGSTSFDQIPPQPIEIPGLQIDGIYYNMFPGCAGNMTFQTWYDEDICKDVNGIDLTKDNRGKAPTPAMSGTPPRGNDTNVPAPSTSPDSTYVDPNPGTDIPTDTLQNPPVQNGFTGTLYIMTWRDAFTVSGEVRATPSLTIAGKYGGLIKRDINNGRSVEWVIQTSIGLPDVTQPNYISLGGSGKEADGSTTITITLLSIVPR
jgi:hypothetical protein